MSYLVDPPLKTPPRERPPGIKRRFLDEAKELLECLDVPVDNVCAVRINRITELP
jgi:hypothetical protein